MKVSLGRPDPPIVGKVTHISIELDWTYLKEKLPNDRRFRFTLQEMSENNRQEWGTVYSGFGMSTVVEGLEPTTEYMFRLCITGLDNERSEYSIPVNVKTTREPLNGESFHKAIILDRKNEVEKILDSTNGIKFLDIPDKFGNLPLMIAIIRSNIEMVELLVEKGADVNAQNESLKTALMLAAFYGKLNIVKLLRLKNASYEHKDKSGMQAVHYAVDGGNADTLEWMLQDGADINARDYSNGWTPLLRAASVNSTKDIARVLVRYKARIDAMDKEDKTALMIATINGNLPFVQILIDNGADFTIKNKFGKSLYDLAYAMERKAIVKYFDEFMEKNNTRQLKS